MIVGRLVYDKRSDRYQIVDKQGEVLHPGLHCGEGVEVMIDGQWEQSRVEYDHRSSSWYLVDTPYHGDLSNLAVRQDR